MKGKNLKTLKRNSADELFDERYDDEKYAKDDYDDCDGSEEKCMYCGYEILKGEKAVKVNCTGDIIHRKCWNDYAEDYLSDLCTDYSCSEED